MDGNSDLPKKRDRTNENFAKARENIIGRCDRISHQYGADIYILIRRKQNHYEYSSIDAPWWPPSKLDLDKFYPVPRRKTPANFSRRPARFSSSETNTTRSAKDNSTKNGDEQRASARQI